MSVILEFQLKVVDFQTITVPLHSTTILGVQAYKKKAVLWVIGESYEEGSGWPAQELKLRMVSNDDEFDKKGLRYIGTFQNGHRWHVFEEL